MWQTRLTLAFSHLAWAKKWKREKRQKEGRSTTWLCVNGYDETKVQKREGKIIPAHYLHWVNIEQDLARSVVTWKSPLVCVSNLDPDLPHPLLGGNSHGFLTQPLGTRQTRFSISKLGCHGSWHCITQRICLNNNKKWHCLTNHALQVQWPCTLGKLLYLWKRCFYLQMLYISLVYCHCILKICGHTKKKKKETSCILYKSRSCCLEESTNRAVRANTMGLLCSLRSIESSGSSIMQAPWWDAS